jgi:hypothetical protein
MALLLVPRLPHHRRLSEQREALQLAVAVKAISLASPFRPHCSVRRQQGALLASPSWARAGEAKMKRGAITHLTAHASTQQSLESSGSACPTREAKVGARAPAHKNKPPSRHTPPPRRLERSTKHNLPQALEVHPREPLLPGQINEALARERPRQQRRPRLIQFEPHALAIPPQYQGRPV